LPPSSARPRDIPDGWEQLAVTFAERARHIVAEHGEGQPDLAAFDAVVAAEEARRLGHDTRPSSRFDLTDREMEILLQAPAIYVPTATGPSAGNVGYELPTSVNLATLASQITALMSGGGSQTITLGTASGGTVVLNGATLSFVVLCQATTSGGLTGSPAGSIPHD
jgi:hypothetical protein